MSLDQAAMAWMARRRRPGATRVLRIVTLTAEAKVWFAVALVFNLIHFAGMRVLPEQHLWLRTLVCPLVAWLAGRTIKRIVRRQRPARTEEDARMLATPRDSSFPSVHAATSASLFVGLALVGYPYAGVVGAWAVLVAFSRWYLGVHYPSDIVGGMALGAAVGWLAPWFASIS